MHDLAEFLPQPERQDAGAAGGGSARQRVGPDQRLGLVEEHRQASVPGCGRQRRSDGRGRDGWTRRVVRRGRFDWRRQRGRDRQWRQRHRHGRQRRWWIVRRGRDGRVDCGRRYVSAHASSAYPFHTARLHFPAGDRSRSPAFPTICGSRPAGKLCIRGSPIPRPQILERALALDPNHRFQTAAEFADDRRAHGRRPDRRRPAAARAVRAGFSDRIGAPGRDGGRVHCRAVIDIRLLREKPDEVRTAYQRLGADRRPGRRRSPPTRACATSRTNRRRCRPNRTGCRRRLAAPPPARRASAPRPTARR